MAPNLIQFPSAGENMPLRSDGQQELFLDLVDYICGQLRIDREGIAAVGVANREQFSDALTQMFGAPEAGAAAEFDHFGSVYAKGGFMRDGSLSVGPAILVGSEVLEGLEAFQRLKSGECEYENLPPEVQWSFYVIAHELSHCTDSQKRPQRLRPIQLPLRVMDLFNRQMTQAIVGEFAAAFLSAKFIGPKLFENEARRAVSCSAHHVQHMATWAWEHNDGPTETVPSIPHIALPSWGIIRLYVWLYSFQAGNPALSQLQVETWGCSSLVRLKQILAQAGQRYPNVPDETWDALGETWREFCRECGLEYEDSDRRIRAGHLEVTRAEIRACQAFTAQRDA